jgi:hypothetical protein
MVAVGRARTRSLALVSFLQRSRAGRRRPRRTTVLVPIIIFLACAVAAGAAAYRWLPPLAPDRVGALAFYVVCGLVASAAALSGLHLYTLVDNLEAAKQLQDGVSDEIVAGSIRSILWEGGALVGIAIAVYLLAPAPPEVGDARAAEPGA